ncbi:hypothetical protein EB796_017899 [Bugula neritina]|uniref:Mpv17-like protein n=1 Tax=Bugula neritina TaxID=10212 RepID=A0A7J7JCM8_BUGNE|nr:hypothetical protein EB796_017899 [Bugula neritina]
MIRLWMMKYPLITGMVSYGGVWTASSITQQKFISKHEVDFVAVRRNTTVAVFVIAPLLHGWYKLAALWFGKGKRTWRTSLKIVVAEQLLFGPVILTSFFLSSGLLMGESVDNIKKEIKYKLPSTYMTSCMFFPLVNFINHLFIPFHLKITYQATVSFIWSNFLCFVKEKRLTEPAGGDEIANLPGSQPITARVSNQDS